MLETIEVALGTIVCVGLLLAGLQIAIAMGIGALLTLLLHDGFSSLEVLSNDRQAHAPAGQPPRASEHLPVWRNW